MLPFICVVCLLYVVLCGAVPGTVITATRVMLSVLFGWVPLCGFHYVYVVPNLSISHITSFINLHHIDLLLLVKLHNSRYYLHGCKKDRKGDGETYRQEEKGKSPSRLCVQPHVCLMQELVVSKNTLSILFRNTS